MWAYLRWFAMLVTQVTCRLHNQSLQLLAPPQTRGCHQLCSGQAAPSSGRGRLRCVHNPSHCVRQSTSSLDHSSKRTQQPPRLSCVLNWKKEKKKKIVLPTFKITGFHCKPMSTLSRLESGISSLSFEQSLITQPRSSIRLHRGHLQTTTQLGPRSPSFCTSKSHPSSYAPTVESCAESASWN